jgi:lambda family phage tail tape measure protein
MGEKDIYIEKLTQQLEQWKTDISALEVKAETAGNEVKTKYEDALDALKQYYDATEARLEEWMDASDDAWDDIEDKAEQQLHNASAAMKSAIDHVKGLFK